jgi:hypothetical protein
MPEWITSKTKRLHQLPRLHMQPEMLSVVLQNDREEEDSLLILEASSSVKILGRLNDKIKRKEYLITSPNLLS